MSDNDLEELQVFPTPFLPPSSQTDQPSSPLRTEDEFELPTPHVHVFVSKKTRAMVAHNTEEGEGQEAMVEVVLLVEVVMQLVEMVTMALLTTMASKEGEGLEAPTNKADLQVDTVIEAGKVVVGIMVEELDDDNNGNRPEYRDHHRFRLHNVGQRPIASNEPERFSLGAMNQRCVHSGALYFVGEVFNCCMGVNVTIPALPPLPN